MHEIEGNTHRVLIESWILCFLGFSAASGAGFVSNIECGPPPDALVKIQTHLTCTLIMNSVGNWDLPHHRLAVKMRSSVGVELVRKFWPRKKPAILKDIPG